MIKIEHVEVYGFEPALRGMRNPKNSWDRGDSGWEVYADPAQPEDFAAFVVGPNDRDLALRLIAGGPVHAKFRRMIMCWADIAAPLDWWIEFDTYREGVEKNSCSRMHKLMDRPLTIEDFDTERMHALAMDDLQRTIGRVNWLIERYKATDSPENKAVYFDSARKLLPDSYVQRRTVMMSYEALANMYRWRKDHRQKNWRDFCAWIESLPNSWIITGRLGECTKR